MSNKYLIIAVLVLMGCGVRKIQVGKAAAPQPITTADSPVLLYSPDSIFYNEMHKLRSAPKTVIPEMVSKNFVLSDAKAIEQVILQSPTQEKKQVKVSIKQKKAATAVSVSRSELELRKNRLSGPSQFDSRIEPIALNSKISWQDSILKNASSIGIVVEKDKIQSVTDTSIQLEISTTLKQRFTLCPDEAFASQPVIGVGTAFIVGNNRMVTASHVFTGRPENYVVIFGFQMHSGSENFTSIISTKNVYYPKKVIHKDNDVDLVVFEVTEDFKKPALTMSKNTHHPLKTEIYMIGYPSGLPQKIALNADVQENNHPQYFYTSLDAFQGNSGSPVFNMATHEVIGVLVSGEVDYVWNGSCNKSSLCRFPYCKGEKVMKISNLSEYLN